MSTVTILHNPRCSKSRQTLALLQEKGIEPTIVEYLKTPLSLEQLQDLYAKLGLEKVEHMMRTKESEYTLAGLKSDGVTDEQRFQAMADYPKLLERPVVIVDDTARIGRPPEAVLEIL